MACGTGADLSFLEPNLQVQNGTIHSFILQNSMKYPLHTRSCTWLKEVPVPWGEGQREEAARGRPGRVWSSQECLSTPLLPTHHIPLSLTASWWEEGAWDC